MTIKLKWKKGMIKIHTNYIILNREIYISFTIIVTSFSHFQSEA